MLIYLADLGHNLLTLSSDVYPLGIANLATYLDAHSNGERHEIKIFREPQDLKAAIDTQAPDVLGLSNYAWNEELALSFARYAKARNPQTLTAMGGPNYPLVDHVREQFLRTLADVDVYTHGPTYEGERAFLELVRRFGEAGRSVEGLLEASVPGNHWIDPKTGEFVQGEGIERIRDLDEIPSPYLSGLLDPFLATGYFPMMQIARGCPFTCAFCNSGVDDNSRVYAHSVENVKADMLYLAERIKPEINLCLADDNFGMYARDEEIADYVGWLQDKYNWPRYIRTTTGKNKTDRILRVLRKTRGALPMTAAVQSMNPAVLKNIKRDNIKLETYRAVQEELEKMDMQSYGELILCLPGETRATFMEAVQKLLSAGAKRISAHQLMLLHGAELSNPDSREKFGFETRFRVVARNIGNYTGEPVIEVEEMVVATPDFTFEDYTETRIFHMLLTIYFYEGNYEEAFEYARQNGVEPYDVVVRMQQLLDEAPAEFRKVLDDFITESKEELFADRESCLAWSKEHYDELVDGTLGGNLLSKYSMLGRFWATQPSFDFLEQVIGRVLDERNGAHDAAQLSTIVDYLRAVALHVPFAETLAATPSWSSRWDVEAWSRDNYAKPLVEYTFDTPRAFVAEVRPESRALIETKVETFGEHPSGLGKITRTLFARDLRRGLAEASSSAESHA